jgi:hypothetical protein
MHTGRRCIAPFILTLKNYKNTIWYALSSMKI